MGSVLVLGGTGEGRRLAGLLESVEGLRTVSSLAGRVAQPALPVGEVRVGGFGGVRGLVSWLVEEGIGMVVDATHPFAAGMSASAAEAAREAGVPLVVLRRAGWTEREGDVWHWVGSVGEAARVLPSVGRRAFLTTGRQSIGEFAGVDGVWFLARSVDPPAGAVPGELRVVLDRGPFEVEDELRLMRDNAIDVLVTKDSGGPMTSAKLDAARRLGIPVVIVRRPPVPPGVPCVGTAEEAAAWVLERTSARDV
ncbi:cobalt-precorrin-6A reductase [Actinocorallia longicatena]|uniref:Cobalt-precorrin-6A reductase n=1 Tax=Actinocorallia longicatena TaxID=111803 RepID=A0ABP6QE29_9ACTN